MNSDPKVFQKFPLGLSKKQWVDFEKFKGGNNETKRKAFERNIERGYQKPFKCPLILKTCLHAEHPHLELLPKKKRQKSKTKRHAKDLDIIRGNKTRYRGQTQEVRQMKPKSKLVGLNRQPDISQLGITKTREITWVRLG